MNPSLILRTEAYILALILFFGMLLMVIAGKAVGKLWKIEPGEAKGSMGALQAAMFGLFGFIIAFSFGISGNRFEAVRNVSVDEANNISTAILRADLYSDSLRTEFRKDFKDYVEARIALYSNLGDTSVFNRNQAIMTEASHCLWKRAMHDPPVANMVTNLMASSLNSMFDIATKRDAVLKTTVPDGIILMLLILGLAASFAAGVTSTKLSSKDWILILLFALFSSLIVYITIDLGRPLRGVIRSETGDQAIIALRSLLSN